MLTGITKNNVNFNALAKHALLNPNQDIVIVVNKFGQNTDIDTAATEDIWSPGGNKVYLTAAETINFSSDSVNDTNAGTGAWNISVSGLDANYDLVEDFIVLNGTSNVVSTVSFIEIHRMVVYQAGSQEDNDGEITAISSGTATLIAAIEPLDGITQMTQYTVPAGYTGFILNETFSVYKADGTGTRQGEISLEVKGFGQTAWVKAGVVGLNSNVSSHTSEAPIILPAKTSIKYRGKAGANNTAMSVQYDLLLIKNTEIS